MYGYYAVYRRTFSIGYRFYYWRHYRKEETKNDGHYDGRSLLNRSELYIKAKYMCMKEELLQNRIYALSVSKFMATFDKTLEYAHSDRIKSMTTRCRDYLHYGIERGSILWREPLVAICLYTDYSNLCCKIHIHISIR